MAGIVFHSSHFLAPSETRRCRVLSPLCPRYWLTWVQADPLTQPSFSAAMGRTGGGGSAVQGFFTGNQRRDDKACKSNKGLMLPLQLVQWRAVVVVGGGLWMQLREVRVQQEKISNDCFITSASWNIEAADPFVSEHDTTSRGRKRISQTLPRFPTQNVMKSLKITNEKTFREIFRRGEEFYNTFIFCWGFFCLFVFLEALLSFWYFLGECWHVLFKMNFSFLFFFCSEL